MTECENQADQKDYAGIAALSICESLLLALRDNRLLPDREITGILRDAAASHENARGTDAEIETHSSVASLINLIMVGGSSISRP